MEESKLTKKKGKGSYLSKNKLTKKQKRIMTVSLLAVMLIVLALLLAFCHKSEEPTPGVPTLTVVTPPKQAAESGDPFTVDVLISCLGEELYPAASLSLNFDSSRLEFLRVEEGNVMILGDERADGNSYQLPQWSVNTERSNQTGQINLMYLDMTGGRYAFTQETLRDDGNVLLRLSFCLRGSAAEGDIYELVVADAVFAASNEENSLASLTGTLKTQNGKIIVGGVQ